MRLIVLTYAFFASIFTGSIYVVTHTHSYEQLIIGQWQEIAWEFEKSDHSTDSVLVIDDEQKAEICKNLTIHEAEIWEFSNGKNMSLYNTRQQPIRQLSWTIKGRGNILELQQPDNGTWPHRRNLSSENYQIQEIKNDTMVIHFNFDLQVRGIVKMTFKRIQHKPNTEEYAAKIP